MWRLGFVGTAVVLLTVTAIGGSSRFDGPVVWPVTENHGLHAGDLVVLTVAAIGLLALVSLGRTTRACLGS